MPVFWLVIVIGTAQPLHVGNFADVEACKKAASEMVRGSVTGSTTATGTGAGATTGTNAGPAPNVAYVCVEAGTEAPTVAAPGKPAPKGRSRR
jgi:hypothetical protein